MIDFCFHACELYGRYVEFHPAVYFELCKHNITLLKCFVDDGCTGTPSDRVCVVAEISGNSSYSQRNRRKVNDQQNSFTMMATIRKIQSFTFFSLFLFLSSFETNACCLTFA